MDGGREGRAGGPSRAKATSNPNAATKPKRKKARPSPTATPIPASGSPSRTLLEPVPQPYLALAPAPVSLLSRSAVDDRLGRSSSPMVLPSSYRRARPSSASATLVRTSASGPQTGTRAVTGEDIRRNSGSATPTAPLGTSNPRRGYAANLVAPPLIMPGGTSATPRIQGQGQNQNLGTSTPMASTTSLLLPPNTTARRRSAENARGTNDRRRSEERLREVSNGNPSMASLGQLGQILEADPDDQTLTQEQIQQQQQQQQQESAAAQRRRRRIVRGESGALARRPTVSSREEGRALGLARGASMRRFNVWDDLPENGDAPPPFPFPTTSTSRLPPTFEPASPTASQAALAESNPQNQSNPGLATIPDSPPPTFEQATILTPIPDIPLIPPPITISAPPPETSAHPPQSTVPSSPTSTEYASAPSSPVIAAIPQEVDEIAEEDREDRKLWNADLLAGYTLEERVERELERSRARDRAGLVEAEGEEGSSGSSPERVPGHLAPTQSHKASDDDSLQVASDFDRTPQRLSPSSEADGPGEIQDRIVEQPQPREESGSPLNPTSESSQVPDGVKMDTSNQTSEITSTLPSNIRSEAHFEVEPAIEVKETEAIPEASRNQVEVEQAEPAGNRDKHDTRGSSSSSSAVLPSLEAEGADVYDDSSAGPSNISIREKSVTPSSHVSENEVINQRHAAVSATESLMAVTARVSTPAKSPEVAQESENMPLETESHNLGSEAIAVGASRSTNDPTNVTKDPSPSNSDVIVENPAPTRKLTRGKAIRRSSSGLKLSSPTSPIGSPQRESPLVRPLFSSGFSFNSSPAPPMSSPMTDDFKDQMETVRSRRLAHRASEPVVTATASIVEEEPLTQRATQTGRFSVDHGHYTGRRLRDAPVAVPEQQQPMDKSTEVGNESVLLPHREAALRRRESAITRPRPLSTPMLTIPKRPSITKANSGLPSGPLIDFNETTPPISPISSTGLSEMRALANSTAELLQLLEEDAAVPVPESSAQAAAKAAMVQELQAEVEKQQAQIQQKEEEPTVEIPPPLPPKDDPSLSTVEESLTPKKKPPPPPPPRSNKAAHERLNGKISIVDTASSPITPRPSIRRPGDATVFESGIPTLAFRRPPPPPPVSSSTPDIIPPSLVNARRPLNLRADSELSMQSGSSTTSSLYDNRSSLTPLPQIKPPPPPLPARRAGTIRPRGPRPPPPPPPQRPWGKIVLEDNQFEVKEPIIRPNHERTHSDGPLMIQTHDLALDSNVGLNPVASNRDRQITSPVRSTSENDLRNPARTRGQGQGPRSPEYTDLDVLVSRLEGSGREYEGFSQIAQFLGPAKSPAATPEAIATLLPGLISVDSRRVTKEGKTKLKLSLLGVRVTKCPICLNQFKEAEQGVLLPECGHVGHERCARRWFREDDRCFVCRVALMKKLEGVV